MSVSETVDVVIGRTIIRVWYTNWRGERAIRTITPVRIFFGSHEWHREEQWLMTVFDYDKQEHRDFALKGIEGFVLTDLPDAPPNAGINP